MAEIMAEVWESIKSFFVKVFRFFVYKETSIDLFGVYLILFVTIGALMLIALTKGGGKGKGINSPTAFVLAILLTIFTLTY